jgi:hypothetical protein
MSKTWKSKTLGISDTHELQLREIKEYLDFDQEGETYKFCFAYAISEKTPALAMSAPKRNTKWAMGNFDEGGDILTVLDALYPEENDLQSILMAKAEAGIEAVHKKVTQEYLYSISELLGH